jgi:hypothetical protein
VFSSLSRGSFYDNLIGQSKKHFLVDILEGEGWTLDHIKKICEEKRKENIKMDF